MAIERTPHTLHIRLDNISPADAIALMKMFKYMEYLGNIGSSRKCSFFADGDGSFHPKASFVYPIELPEVPEIDGVNEKTRDFSIDSDEIAWHIYHDPEPKGYNVRPLNYIPPATNGKLSSKIGGE
jgi:hypothetical protein